MVQSKFEYTEELDDQELLLVLAEVNHENVDVDVFDGIEVYND